MSNRKDKVTDVLSVIKCMKNEFENASGYRAISELRKNAVQEVSIAEFHLGRYKNKISAYKTIHDACARRLRPKIQNISVFDRLAEKSLRQNSKELKSILTTFSISMEQKKLLDEFFN